MDQFFAVMAGLGMLTTAYGLSYPIGYIIERTINCPLAKLELKRQNWDEFNADFDARNSQ